jgi:PAS domain-containing protein
MTEVSALSHEKTGFFQDTLPAHQPFHTTKKRDERRAVQAESETPADAVLILDAHLTISYCNQQFLDLEQGMDHSVIGKNLLQCIFKIIPPGLYEHIEMTVPGMVIKRTCIIPKEHRRVLYQYQILGILHGDGSPGVIILIQTDTPEVFPGT